jgi:hypothetical protein
MLVEQTKHIADYLKAVNALYAQSIATEHSFRGDLAVLLGKMTNYAVVNEAQHINCGAPDLTLLSKDIPVGYVEAKDIGKNLNSKDYKSQFDRYKFQIANGLADNSKVKAPQPPERAGLLNYHKIVRLLRVVSAIPTATTLAMTGFIAPHSSPASVAKQSQFHRT